MKASVGDRIIIVPRTVGGPVRDARVVEVRNPDGSPPYLVEWSDSGQQALYFPGSDGRIEHLEDQPEQRDTGGYHVKTWRVTVHVFEHDPSTAAHAVLIADSGIPLEAKGSARRAPSDPDVPEIGDEVAVARALRELADSLMATATKDMAGAAGGDRAW
ncbi:dsRBD fold-containing protein [Longivirga aurantiaca]|uniref:DsRBD fold-containing protein n=1 Tax=Longivirga aurantiaca TaxID=1837743 RepID=A0ABW1T207_9ACTN